MIYQTTFLDSNGEKINFNLYGMEDIDPVESKKQILNEIETKHLTTVKDIFKKVGIKFIKFIYYSPAFYNYEGDDLNVELEIADKRKLIDFTKRNAIEIEKRLNKNKSYSGYTSFTADTIEEVISEIEDKKTVDNMLVGYILEGFWELSQDDIYENLCYEEEPEHHESESQLCEICQERYALENQNTCHKCLVKHEE